MNCPRCGADLVLVGQRLLEKPHQSPPDHDDSPAGVVASVRHHIAVARMSKDPALQALLDDLEQALEKLA